ncbi:hypothetical protein AMEX_G13606 [Astyanax mexicanus]|uniref:Uncharacterized protein n=1 Tax=Astyanax mexicanus TaxID=7994 RepID=A0A8T2LRW5_ASTMX|nr:hypothetical protein AMEX_G13606 [Astyanax mexicanus]
MLWRAGKQVCFDRNNVRTTWCTWCPPWADWSPPPWEIFPFALGLLCWTHPWFEVLRRVWVCVSTLCVLAEVVFLLGREGPGTRIVQHQLATER